MDRLIIHQVGGKQLGQGAYGCIFDPPLRCRTGKKSQPGSIGKLSTFETLKQEIVAATLFSKKPEAKKYFIFPELSSLCKPAPLEQQTEPELSSCKVIFDPYFNQKDIFQYSMEFGGTPLKNITKQPSFSPSKVSFVAIMQQLLEAGAYLLLNGYIHNDLHSENIVLKPDGLPRLIDWNRSFSYKQINSEMVNNLIAGYAPELSQIPPENTTIDGLWSKVPFQRILYEMKTQKGSIRDAELYLGVSRNKIINDFAQFWSSSKAAEKKDWVSLYRLYWPVNDSWMIGHVLLSLLRRLSDFKDFTQGPEWLKNKERVKEILRGMLRGSPRDRLDCLEALALFDPMNEIVTGTTGATWLERKQAQRHTGRALLRGGGAEEGEFIDSDDE